ncbi:MAG: hypothetical protein CL949_23310 [Erythrobacter sp.]|nr:hypothetical protein [Erythrobacter sp.]
MKNPIIAVALLAVSPLVLTACESAEETTSTPAEEEGRIAGIEITNARLVLPPVSGNPAAIYFDIANNGDRTLAFRNAEVTGSGKAEVHDTIMEDGKMVMGEAPPILVESGSTVQFAPGGKHVMVFDLGRDVSEGSTVEVTLIAAGNKRHSFDAAVQAAGDAR